MPDFYLENWEWFWKNFNQGIYLIKLLFWREPSLCFLNNYILSICCAVLSHSVVFNSETPWTIAHQDPVSIVCSYCIKIWHWEIQEIFMNSFKIILIKSWMLELDHTEGWAPKNWYFWTVVLEKTLKESLGLQGDQPVHPKGNQSRIFVWGIDAEAEAPVLWPPDGKSQLIRKDPDSGKDWRWEEKGMTEDEMVGWHYRLNWCKFEQALKNCEGQGSLTCCSPWGSKELDTTEQFNNK